jgi:hypothetical protein
MRMMLVIRSTIGLSSTAASLVAECGKRPDSSFGSDLKISEEAGAGGGE